MNNNKRFKNIARRQRNNFSPARKFTQKLQSSFDRFPAYIRSSEIGSFRFWKKVIVCDLKLCEIEKNMSSPAMTRVHTSGGTNGEQVVYVNSAQAIAGQNVYRGLQTCKFYGHKLIVFCVSVNLHLLSLHCLQNTV